MYWRVYKWEFFGETVPLGKKLLDWHISPSEKHLWVGTLHLVFNRTLEHFDGKADRQSDGGSV